MIVSILDHDPFVTTYKFTGRGGGYYDIDFADERKGGPYKFQNIFAQTKHAVCLSFSFYNK